MQLTTLATSAKQREHNFQIDEIMKKQAHLFCNMVVKSNPTRRSKNNHFCNVDVKHQADKKFQKQVFCDGVMCLLGHLIWP
ncbi:hypothetical protein L1987_53274 [Smallanthus sonchifolius]|uniref:Uncharacterized protein n=1 Tax=Smallanthus sonchifolius TaxID=185202 RepID=A0ACB9EVF8_9ASTR|nr:hypothetical protein L1987_53274 [Smallanthus sonchifolius]